MTSTNEEIKQLEADLLPLKHRLQLERMASGDGTATLSGSYYAIAWALLKLLGEQPNG